MKNYHRTKISVREENSVKKSGRALSVHTAVGFNMKGLRQRVAASIKKICLKHENFRITISENLGKFFPKFSQN